MRHSVSTCDRSVTRWNPAPYARPVFRTELTKRRAIDLVRVAGMLCLMP